MNVLVIGDLMIDEWVYGDVDRLSPEAPIPIVDVERKITSLGGAGNVLVNLNTIGANPMVISGVSENYTGHLIKKLVEGICGENAFYFNIPQSFKKQRICGANQQIVRIDTGKGKDISDIEIEQYLERTIKDDVSILDAILIADYGKGAVTETVLSDVSDYCYQANIPFLIDPYMRDYYYCERLKCSLIKFNRNEAENFTGVRIKNDDDLRETGRILLDTFKSESILITLGPEGMAYFDRKTHKVEPYRRIDNPLHVYDVCGAGDVVFAVLGYMMAGGRNYEDMMEMAVRAGKVAVSKKGTSVITKDDLWGI